MAIAIAVAVWVVPVAAQPTGGTVVFGGATISAPNANSTVIKQSTNSAIINWQSFSLSSGSSVVFDQPNAAAIALNRVLGGGVSHIDGSLTANGQVWIINANGILFGKGSQINVAGLLATTSDIADGDFAAGRYNFSSPSSNPSASVDNAGTIHVANGGSAVLSAPHVSNSGLIQADGGQIVLGGANAFTVDFEGDDLLRYAITTPVAATPTDANGVPQKALVANSGTLSAAGGRILLTARAAANVADNVVNNTGMISATSAAVHNGEVVLDAGDGSVQDSGTINATGNSAGQTGGNVALAGNSVTIADNATIDASGDQGGGTISIGGGLHGSGPYQSAQNTVVGNATIHADAHTSGNGGTVSIWSNGTTQFAGTVTAMGGAQSGNGGMVETSGHVLSVASTGTVNTGAAHGARGEWLLDPLNLTIVDDPTLPDPLVNGTFSYNSCSGCNSSISAQTVELALTTTNVTLQAVDDIFVNAAISATGTGHTLELDAGRSIFVNSNINLTGNGGTVVLSAKSPGAIVPGGSATDPGAASISGAGNISADFVVLRDLSDGSDGGSIGSSGASVLIGAGKVSVQTGGANAFLQASGGVGGGKADLLLSDVSVGAGRLNATASGNLTIAAGATLSSSNDGDAVVLAAGQNFVNDSGSDSVSLTGGGRFLIYSQAPGGDTFGGLNSGNTAIWNTTYPTAIAANGDRYVFANQPTLTFTSTNLAKTYGTDGSTALASAFTVSGFDPGVAGAYLGDTSVTAFSGAPSLSSAGAAAGATVAGGPYQITIGSGSLVSSSGYAFQFVSSGVFTVNPALLSVTANPLGKVYGTSDPTLTYGVSGLVNGDTSAVFTGALARATGENVGIYAINQGTLSAGSNYTIAFTGANFTITQALLSVTADTLSKVYGSSDPTLTYTFSGLANGDTSAVFSGALSRALGENVGKYAIGQGTLSAGANYTIAFTGANFSITPALLSVTANPQSKVYGTADPALTYSFSGLVNNDTSAVFVGGLGRALGENVGNYAITQGTLSAGGNYTIAFTGANFAITPATLTYIANSANRTYGSANPLFNGTVTGFVNGDTQQTATTGTLTFTSPATSTSNVGSYAINGSGLSANHGNYVFVQAAGNATALTITAATLTYVANPFGRTYGAANPAFAGAVTGFVNGDTQASATTGTLTFTSPATVTSNVGSYAINGSGLSANNGNYIFVQAAGNATALTITAATLTYVADPFSRAYGAANPVLTGTVTGFVNGESIASATTGTLTFTSPATTTSGVGHYAINGSGLSANNGNYVFVQAAGNATALTITQALLSVIADPQTKVYGAKDPALTYTFSGLVNGDTSAVFVGALTRAPGQNVGNYAITQGTLSAGPNYAIEFTGANFAITPALLSVTANPQTKVYGAADPKLTYSFTGLVNGDTSAVFVGALTRAAGQNVGDYAITQGTLGAGGNYTIAFTGANFAITPATLTYVANSANRIYGSANPALGGQLTGFVNGDTLASATTGTLTFTTTATSSSNVGSYAINGSGVTANNGNYIFVQAASNATALTINPATLTYVATSGTIDQGTPIPVLTGMVTGFVNGDTLASATSGTAVFTTIATSASPPGVYAITGSGLAANHGNYVFVQDPGNATALTINKVIVENVGLDGFFPWTSGGDRPTDGDSNLGQYNNGGDQVYVVADNGGNNLPTPDTTTLSGPIAELTAAQGYLDQPTNTDRRSSALSRYFGNGSLFDGNFPSWGNDAFWH